MDRGDASTGSNDSSEGESEDAEPAQMFASALLPEYMDGGE